MSGSATLDHKSLDQRLDRLSDLLEKSGQSFHMNRDLGAVSYFEPTDDVITGSQLKSHLPSKRLRRLPRDYSERQFKSYGDFLKSGMKNPDDFADRYGKQRKAVMK